MQKLEKILEEINKIYVDDIGVGVDCNLQGRSDLPCDNCYECIKDACKDIIRKHMNDGWISVEERLPDNNENVLVTTDMGLIASGYVAHGEWITDQEPDYPIAWRPLPDPYNPKEDN